MKFPASFAGAFEHRKYYYRCDISTITIISRRTGLVIFVIGFVMLWLQGPIATFVIIPYLTLFIPPEQLGYTPLSITHILSISVLVAGIAIFFVARKRDSKE